jgi:hypothetical protein
MKITYQPNPLNTIVELDEYDIEILRLKLIIEDLDERIYGANFRLEPGERFNPEEAIKELDVDSLEEIDVSKNLQWMIEELKSSHCGDCTCVPCSCLKCHAEHLLGIDTIPKLGKHSAHKIEGAFGNNRNIDEAIEYLVNYKPIRDEAWLKFPPEDFEKHIPRWTEEAKRAAEWLKDYKEKRCQR